MNKKRNIIISIVTLVLVIASVIFNINYTQKDVEEISNTLCTYCNSKAKMNLKLVDGKPEFKGEKVNVDKELYTPQYVPVCPICFTKKMLKNNLERV